MCSCLSRQRSGEPAPLPREEERPALSSSQVKLTLALGSTLVALVRSGRRGGCGSSCGLFSPCRATSSHFLFKPFLPSPLCFICPSLKRKHDLRSVCLLYVNYTSIKTAIFASTWSSRYCLIFVAFLLVKPSQQSCCPSPAPLSRVPFSPYLSSRALSKGPEASVLNTASWWSCPSSSVDRAGSSSRTTPPGFPPLLPPLPLPRTSHQTPSSLMVPILLRAAPGTAQARKSSFP